MKCLNIFRIINSASGISRYRAIHTDGVMFARRRARNVPHKINHEPGLRHAETILSEDSDMLEIENEEDLIDRTEFMNFEKEFDSVEDERRRRERLGYIITAKKFFKGPPHPATLSCNERECIRYLHKTDPVNWNTKTLSESFPALPDAIKKVLKGKFKHSEEIKRKMDLKVQKNWQLFSEGKLQAAPELLEHMKKFINRKEVLLDQIKKEDFYLPEVKEEVSWNNGEMSSILVHYEKAIEQLAQKQKPREHEMLSDGSPGTSGKVKKQMNICASSEKSEKLKDVREKCNLLDSRTEFAFPNEFKKVFCDGSAKIEIEDSSSQMKKSNKKSGIEKLMLKDVEKKCNSPDSRTEFAFPNEFKKVFSEVGLRTEPQGSSAMKKSEEKYGIEKLMLKDVEKQCNSPDSRTEFAFPNELKKAFCDGSSKIEIQDSSSAMKKSEEKSGIKGSVNKKDFSDPERLRLENQYFANQVKDIEDTAFWNRGRTSQDKALAESKKAPLGGPDTSVRGQICSSDVYPERIKIPRDKRGSGLTFKVKDCYYDDDGEFLYRVPGMVK